MTTQEQKAELEDIKKKMVQNEKEMLEEERLLKLAEAGLRDFPLEADFVAFQRFKFEQNKARHILGKKMIEMLERPETTEEKPMDAQAEVSHV